jgi:hypothetical protein
MTGSNLQVTTIAAALAMGFLPALWGRLRLAQGATPLPADAIDRLEKTCLFLSLPFMLAAGWVVDRWGAHDVLFAGSLFSALAIAGFGMRPNFESLRGVAVVLAAAIACITIATTVIMSQAFFESTEPAASLNLGFIAVAVGYLLLPMLADGLWRRLGLRATMIVLAVTSAVPAVLVVVTPKADWPPAAAGSADALSSPAFWLAAAIILLYFPVEAFVSRWTAGYLKDLGYAQWRPAFWALFLFSRFLTGQFIVPGYELWLVLVLILLAAITLGNLAGAYGQSSARGLLLLGGWLGPILPCLLGTVISLSGPSAGVAVGTAYAVGGASTLVLLPALISFGERHGPQAGMRMPFALALAISVPVLVLALIR